VKLSAVRTNEGRLFQTVEAQHENRPAAIFVDEDCVDSRSDVDDLRTRDCLYGSVARRSFVINLVIINESWLTNISFINTVTKAVCVPLFGQKRQRQIVQGLTRNSMS